MGNAGWLQLTVNNASKLEPQKRKKQTNKTLSIRQYEIRVFAGGVEILSHYPHQFHYSFILTHCYLKHQNSSVHLLS